MTYTETLEFLYNALPVFQQQGPGAYKPGLGRVAAFNDALGQPDRVFRSIHVAGTNGKGSVSHMIASVLQTTGYRVGLYTSPHLRDFRERIRVNGRMIPEQEVVSFVERHRRTMIGMELSFFEMSVGLAFDWFARQHVDFAVIETGLGGRLDATNIIRPELSVITNIGFDHMSLLGSTIPQIAAEKAGIIKSGIPVVVGEEDALSAPVFRETAERKGCSILFAETMYRVMADETPDGVKLDGNPDYVRLDETPDRAASSQSGDRSRSTQKYCVERLKDGSGFGLEVDLLGDYQQRNVVTALASLWVLNESCHLKITRCMVVEGFRYAASATGLSGRWQVLGHAPLTVADAGHNEHGIRQVVAQIGRQRYDKLYFVLGVVNDKDLSMILPLLPSEAYYLFTQASVTRALPATDLAAQAARYGLHGEVVSSVPEAYARARALATEDDMIFVGGSTFTVAEVI